LGLFTLKNRELNASSQIEVFYVTAMADLLQHWCVTSGPRATCDPQQVTMRPMISNRKS